MTDQSENKVSFHDFGLQKSLLKAIFDAGFTEPTPIQSKTIPLLMEGRDLLGQAQTGTGKTAAFALPLLNRINTNFKVPQVLVLTPTRELALQVSEAFYDFSEHMKGLRVLAVYGGQDIRTQLNRLKRGVHVVVGTPGRIMDMMRREKLDLSVIECLILDEADEMLRMGFIDDVEWILERTPKERQVALFSATLPPAIRRIAHDHFNNPEEITIKVKTTTADTIHQRYWLVSGLHKLDALTRILEAEEHDGVIIFVNTKAWTIELSENLNARGFKAVPLNGDIPQNMREQTVDQIKAGKLDILVATDVAARGLDVDRISHVINYDMPQDTEVYVHRVGRTGRAGRHGEAILFVAPRERRMLRSIEDATRQKIEMLELPSVEVINNLRRADFKLKITRTLDSGNLDLFRDLIEEYHKDSEIPLLDIAASLAKMYQGDSPFMLEDKPIHSWGDIEEKTRKRSKRKREFRQPSTSVSSGMIRYRVEVGRNHGVKPGNIVGALTNEAGLEYENVGKILINSDYSTIDLPEDLPVAAIKHIHQIQVIGHQLKISKFTAGTSPSSKPKFPKKDNQYGKFKKSGKKSSGAKSKRGKKSYKKS